MSSRDDSQLSVILDRFDAAWARGRAPEIRDFLPDEVDHLQAHKSIAIELVAIDLERRWRVNKFEAATIHREATKFPTHPHIEDYVTRYPELGTIDTLPVALICHEYKVRNQWGDRPSRNEYLKRFPGRSMELESALSKIDNLATGGERHTDDATLPPERSGKVNKRVASGGEQYFGGYELLNEIARGGMGVVYKARQVKLNRIVALKMILSGELAGEDAVQRFRTEAESAASLDHPGIVPIYEIGEYGGKHYFSMGFVEGVSLAGRLSDGPLPPKDAAAIMKNVADAVEYAHTKGVIHRDLKPANVLLDRNGEPRVTDFGLAKQVGGNSNLTRSGAVIGTPSYMPPEQASGSVNEIGPTTDVYSLGAMLYSLLTGRPPFQSANPMDTLMQVMEQEPIPVCKVNSNAPKELETICLKCLQKSPTERYESVGELSGELARYLKGEPIKSRPISTFERLIKYSKRSPLTNALLCIIIVIISVLLFPLATLDSQVLDAYQDALSSSAPWFFIIGIVLGIWVIQDLAIWLGFKTFRSLFASPKEGNRTRLAAADVVWRAVWVVAIAFPLLCVLVLIVQLIRYARGEIL